MVCRRPPASGDRLPPPAAGGGGGRVRASLSGVPVRPFIEARLYCYYPSYVHYYTTEGLYLQSTYCHVRLIICTAVLAYLQLTQYLHTCN